MKNEWRKSKDVENKGIKNPTDVGGTTKHIKSG